MQQLDKHPHPPFMTIKYITTTQLNTSKSMNKLMGHIKYMNIQIGGFFKKKKIYLIMHRYSMTIIDWHMSKAFEEVHKTFCNRVRTTGVYVMHLHLSIRIHI